MTNYKAIKNHCLSYSKLSEKVIDEWLVYYAATKDDLEKQFRKNLKPYSHVAKLLEKSDVNRMLTQIICHKVFKEGGLIKKYLNHSQFKLLTPEELGFLEFHTGNPWRFCYSIIVDRPAPDFFMMEDQFTGEQFLLYSPGTSITLKDRGRILLWFNLIAYNGQCWQTYGPILGFNSFNADDIFFFGTELNPMISSDQELLEDLSLNPIPYLMLITFAAIPMAYHKEKEIIYAIGEFDVPSLDFDAIREHFRVEYAHGYYRITEKEDLGTLPYNTAFFDEKRGEIFVSSTTDQGYANLIASLSDCGCPLPEFPNLRIHISMLSAAERILKKKITINPYDKFFPETPNQAEEDEVDKINVLLSLILPSLNAGKTPDLAAAAKKAGVDLNTAKDLLLTIQEKFKKMGR